jgi:hypothetical protein
MLAEALMTVWPVIASINSRSLRLGDGGGHEVAADIDPDMRGDRACADFNDNAFYDIARTQFHVQSLLCQLVVALYLKWHNASCA